MQKPDTANLTKEELELAKKSLGALRYELELLFPKILAGIWADWADVEKNLRPPVPSL
jgi:hypothetical protein